MKSIVVVNSFSLSPGISHKAERIQEELRSRGISCEVKRTVDLPILFQGGREEIPGVNGAAFCVFLDKDKYLIRALERILPVYNSSISTFLCDDKMVTFQALAGQGIPTPLTIPAPLCYADDPDPWAWKAFLDRVEGSLGYPLICKECYGSLGRQVYLIEDRKGLEKVNRKLWRTTHLYQKAYPSSFGRDVRVVTVGGRTVAAMERVNEKDFRSNVAEGGEGRPIALKKSFSDLAEKVSRLLGLDYAGIDLLEDVEGKPIFLEANSNCFFAEIERVTKVDVAKILVDHILQDLHRRGIL